MNYFGDLRVSRTRGGLAPGPPSVKLPSATHPTPWTQRAAVNSLHSFLSLLGEPPSIPLPAPQHQPPVAVCAVLPDKEPCLSLTRRQRPTSTLSSADFLRARVLLRCSFRSHVRRQEERRLQDRYPRPQRCLQPRAFTFARAAAANPVHHRECHDRHPLLLRLVHSNDSDEQVRPVGCRLQPQLLPPLRPGTTGCFP